MADHVTLFPQDSTHRLVARDLSAFFDRLSERVIALGDGATAKVRAGSYEANAETFLELVLAIDAAREAGRGRVDLKVELAGDVRDEFARFIGSRTCKATFEAFVLPKTLKGAKRCAGCGWPLETEGKRLSCPSGCKPKATRDTLAACWWLRLSGMRRGGLGERFAREGRRLRGSPFFEALQGTARTPLYEWHAG